MTRSGVLVEDLDFGYGGYGSYGSCGERLALKGIRLDAPPGTITAVVGPNGSGKSTLLKVISGYLRPRKGNVSIKGLSPHDLPPDQRSALVTYVGDEPEPAFDFTVEETVALGRVGSPKRVPDSAEPLALTLDRRTQNAMERVDVAGLKDRAVTALSSGEKQRVYLARALNQDPEVFLLDEPTSHLDMAHELRVMDMVARMAEGDGKTVIAVHHDLNLALRYAARLYFLKDGAVAFSLKPGEVTEEVVGEVYGVGALVSSHPFFGHPFIIPKAPLE